jgi:hypothetical protein
MRARECRGTGGPPGHMYGPDGHVHTGQQMIRKIVTKMYSHFVFRTNSYSPERASGQWPPNMKVWKMGHKWQKLDW